MRGSPARGRARGGLGENLETWPRAIGAASVIGG